MLRKLVVDGGKSRFGRRPRLAVLGAATVLISLALFGVFGGEIADGPKGTDPQRYENRVKMFSKAMHLTGFQT